MKAIPGEESEILAVEERKVKHGPGFVVLLIDGQGNYGMSSDRARECRWNPQTDL